VTVSPSQKDTLRDQIAAALTAWVLSAAGAGIRTVLQPPDAEALRANSLARADAVMTVVSPVLEQLRAESVDKDAEIARLRDALDARIQDFEVFKREAVERAGYPTDAFMTSIGVGRMLFGALTDAEDERDRLQIAWWSARIRAVLWRDEARRIVREDLSDLDDRVVAAWSERDRAKAELGARTTTVAHMRNALADLVGERDRFKDTLTRHEDLLASIVLHINWRWVTRKLTTEQKELFAEALEHEAIRAHGPDGDDPDPELMVLPAYTPRWWRDDYQPEGPQPVELAGLDPNITGGLPAEEYLRRMRAGTLDQPEEKA
jgi:hypothetical protein